MAALIVKALPVFPAVMAKVWVCPALASVTMTSAYGRVIRAVLSQGERTAAHHWDRVIADCDGIGVGLRTARSGVADRYW